MAWSESAGDVSLAFKDWRATDSDIRSYMELSQKWAKAAYATTLEDAKREFSRTFDPDRDDPDEYIYDFLKRVGGLWEEDYLWMLRAGALRDAVTAFEVYAEKSASEVLKRWRATTADGDARHLAAVVAKQHVSPSWSTLCRIHEALGNDLRIENVEYVRKLRHLLAHQRGELRTEKLRNEFVKETGPRRGGPFDSRDIPLGHARVLNMMDDLASAVRACDTSVWNHTWGRKPPTALIALTEGKNSPLLGRFAR